MKKETKELIRWHDDMVAENARDAERNLIEFIELVKKQRESRSPLHKFMDAITGWDIMYKER